MLQVRERIPTPSFVVFIFELAFESYEEFGVCQVCIHGLFWTYPKVYSIQGRQCDVPFDECLTYSSTLELETNSISNTPTL